MTDARLPERFLSDRRIRKLSDPAHRLFINSLVWSVANRSDGLIYDDDLALIPDIDRDHADELIKQELWRRDRDRWLIVDYAETQTSKHELEVLANVRKRDRLKKARQRAAVADDDESPGTSPGTNAVVPRDSTGRQEGKAGSEGRTTTTNAGTVASVDDACVHPGCHNPPRHGLLTCLDHALLEIEYTAAARTRKATA